MDTFKDYSKKLLCPECFTVGDLKYVGRYTLERIWWHRYECPNCKKFCMGPEPIKSIDDKNNKQGG
jgi:hypothetical protein